MNMKQLDELSLVELWRMFPVKLVKHHHCWHAWFKAEEAFLKAILPVYTKVHHIGSTAIKNILSKPTIDILVEVEHCNFEAIRGVLTQNGYMLMSDTNTRCSFNKGYTPKGYEKRVFHLHLRRFNDNDELYFRDYLNEYPMLAKEYEAIKLALCRQFKCDRDEYTKGKASFVHEYTEKAIQKYGRIY